MIEAEREMWKRAAGDYGQALAIAVDVWSKNKLTPTAEALQAASATILLHHKYLVEMAARLPAIPAPMAVTRGMTEAPQAPAAGSPRKVWFEPGVPACPACQGPMKDVRGTKSNPAAPDFKCAKGKACMTKGFVTGIWEKDLPKQGAAQGLATMGAQRGYDEMPDALRGDAKDDDLPF